MAGAAGPVGPLHHPGGVHIGGGRTAAQIRLDIHSPLSIHPEAALIADAIPRGTTELLTQQATAEAAALQTHQIEEELHQVIRTARTMASILGVLFAALTGAIVSLPLWLPAVQHLDLDVRPTLSAGVFVLISTLATLGLSLDTVQRIAPGWLRSVGRLIRGLRSG